jgi:hypothetical protein
MIEETDFLAHIGLENLTTKALSIVFTGSFKGQELRAEAKEGGNTNHQKEECIQVGTLHGTRSHILGSLTKHDDIQDLGKHKSEAWEYSATRKSKVELVPLFVICLHQSSLYLTAAPATPVTK